MGTKETPYFLNGWDWEIRSPSLNLGKRTKDILRYTEI